jgi:hypothetical protein
MTTAAVALVLAVAGVIITRWGVGRLAASARPPAAHVSWCLGLIALVPGWLVALVTLLGTRPGEPPQAATTVPWTLSTAAGLIGAIGSEARVRRAGDAPPPTWYWWAGLTGFVPAWALAVAGHVLRALM